MAVFHMQPICCYTEYGKSCDTMLRTYFFDADGRSTAVSGKIDYDQFEHWIKSGMHDG